MLFAISTTKLRRLRRNFVYSFLNKSAAKICKHFPPHVNNVSTLPCETWNVHHVCATTALSEKETPEFIPSQLWPSNSPDLNPVDNSVWEYCKRRCTCITDLDELKQRLRTERAKLDHVVIGQPFVSGVVDSCRSVTRVLYTSLAIFPTHCYQLDSKLVNLQTWVR